MIMNQSINFFLSSVSSLFIPSLFIFSFFGRRQQDSKIERNASKYRPMLMDIIKYVLFLVSS